MFCDILIFMSEKIKATLSKLVLFQDLTRIEMIGAMREIVNGEATDAQIGAWITALRMKGEKVDEITGAAEVLREKCVRIDTGGERVVDLCGTGGDGTGTFNISTTAAFVAAGAGVTVAKHGNRAISSSSGSADLLLSLGVKIDVAPKITEECLRAIHIGFLFAPTLHPAMKHAAGPRKETGIRSIFNILGPLSNPAGAEAQLIGVYRRDLVEPIALALKNLGLKRAFVVHGMDGLDEITLTDQTLVAELRDREIRTFTIQPEDFGFQRCGLEALAGGNPGENAEITRRILKGEKGPCRDVTILNAGAAIMVGGRAEDLREGIELAGESIDSGKAMQKLDELVRLTNSRT